MNPLYTYFILVSLLASLTVYIYNRPAPLYLKLFPPFLLTTFCVEKYGLYLSGHSRSNVLLYNSFSAFEFCFYLFILSMVIARPTTKKVVYAVIAIYAAGAAVNIFFIQKNTFHTITYSIGCLLVVTFCIIYFLELFRLPKSVKLHNNPAFWICSGLLFYFCCGFPLFGLINYLVTISDLLIRNFFLISTILNITLYSLFTIGFLCRLRIRKYTS